MNLVDTHFHLDLWNDPKSLIKRIEDEKIYTIAVTNAPSVFKLTYQLTKGLKYIRPALGYHPEVIGSRPNDLSLFIKYINLTRYIGEIGLDYACNIDKALQINIFSSIIRESNRVGGKIVSIHSRKAEKDIIDIVGSGFNGDIILHWYSGNITQLKRAVDYGYYFSINYPMTQSKNGRSIIRNIPINRLLIESDGPFAYTEDESSSPLLIQRTICELSSILGVSQQNMSKLLFNNFKFILGNSI
jgi:TatD DNase family protein